MQRDFNGLGQMTSDWQEHTGVKTGSTLRVHYAYSFAPNVGGAERLVAMLAEGLAGRFDITVATPTPVDGFDDSVCRGATDTNQSGRLKPRVRRQIGDDRGPPVDLVHI